MLLIKNTLKFLACCFFLTLTVVANPGKRTIQANVTSGDAEALHSIELKFESEIAEWGEFEDGPIIIDFHFSGQVEEFLNKNREKIQKLILGILSRYEELNKDNHDAEIDIAPDHFGKLKKKLAGLKLKIIRGSEEKISRLEFDATFKPGKLRKLRVCMRRPWEYYKKLFFKLLLRKEAARKAGGGGGGIACCGGSIGGPTCLGLPVLPPAIFCYCVTMLLLSAGGACGALYGHGLL